MTKLVENTEENKIHRSFITMGEEGMLIVWDLKKILNYEDMKDLKFKKNISKWEPMFVIPFSRRNQSTCELGGNQIIIDIKDSKINKEKKL